MCALTASFSRARRSLAGSNSFVTNTYSNNLPCRVLYGAVRDFTYQSRITTLGLGCAFQEIDCLSDMFEGQFNRAAASLGKTGMCCYSTEAVIQNLGRRTELFAFIAR